MFRRVFVAGVGLAPAIVFARDDGLATRCLAAIRAALAAIPPGPALLNSYLVETGSDRADFDLTQANAAYVYDNALADELTDALRREGAGGYAAVFAEGLAGAGLFAAGAGRHGGPE